MAVTKKTKQPSEVLDYDFKYTDWLDSGDEIESAEVTVATGITLDSYNIVSPGIVKVWLSGGTDGETYLITCVATTEGGREKEKEFKLKIKEVA